MNDNRFTVGTELLLNFSGYLPTRRLEEVTLLAAQESVSTASSNFKFDECSSSSITVTNDKATTSILKNLSHILKILMSNRVIRPF